MFQWNLVPAWLGLIIILILVIYLRFDRKNRISYTDKSFQTCLYMTLAGIAVNIASVYCLEYPSYITPLFNYLMQMMDFVFGGLASFFIFRYLILMLHENFNDPKHLRLSLQLLFWTSVIYFLVIGANYFTGWQFYFDAEGNYQRGPYNKVLFVLYLTHCIFMFTGFFHYRKNVHRMFYRLTVLSIFAGTVIIGLQLLFPDVMLASMGAALAVLIIFISSQQSQSNTDPLTGAYNRSSLYYSLENAIHKRIPFYLLSIEIRDFNSLNTQHGQRNGDLVLRAIVQGLQRVANASVYRMIGASFVLLVFDKPERNEQILANVKTLFKQPWDVAGIRCHMEASFVDIVGNQDMYHEPDKLIAWLEYATRYAKQKSRLQYLHFDKTLKDSFARREELVAYIKDALKEQRFRLCFQPIFSVKANGYVGAEALIRLNSPSGKPVSPGEFIPIAEETGLIEDIGYYVIEEVCKFLKNLHKPWFIAINISAQQFVKDDFVMRYTKIIEKHGIDPSRIRFELTEYVMLNYEEVATENMSELEKIGTHIFLDDFGTGYSNLFVLSSLPISVVKIDKSLTWNIDKESVFEMVKAFIYGIQRAGISVLVEGIEKEEQRTVFEKLGAEMIQGYYFSKPLEVEEFYQQFNQ